MEIIFDTDLVKHNKGEMKVEIKTETMDALKENEDLLSLIGDYVISLDF